jgi:release factor glutamine methyltransferase
VRTLDRALQDTARQLAGVSDTPRLDAELLLAHALGIERETLLLWPPSKAVPDSFAGMVKRRMEGEPLAYITGRRAFWNIELEVGPGVLIPRPDSETLVASAVEHWPKGDGPRRILDLGTGPGTLLLAALDQWSRATGLGIDSSPVALEFARNNARRLGLSPRAHFRLGNWAEGVTETFDLILCNPPYVASGAELGAGVLEHEPAEALFAGPQGLDDYRRLAPVIPRLLAPGGLAAVEIGADQHDSAADLFRAAGCAPRLARDLAGRPRALLIECSRR